MNPQTEYPVLHDPEMKEIVESFQVETKEILELLSIDLINLEKNPEDDELLNKVFRSFHTIKGTSGFLGLNKLTLVTHKCEDILNKLRKKEAKLSPGTFDGILAAYDIIKELLVVIESEKNENVEVNLLIEDLEEIIKEISGETKSAGEKAPENKPGNCRESQVKVITEDEKNRNQNGGDEKILRKSAAGIMQNDNTVRVDVSRLDELLNITSELVLGRNMLLQVNSEFAAENEGTSLARNLFDAVKQIDLMTNELQLTVMKARMVKIGKIFNRFPRLVRDLSKDAGKKIELAIMGEETELDKTLIEELHDPLVHLIRNCSDHGIESPDERVKAGKNPAGKITLSAQQQGNQIILIVEDDGRGMDPEILKQKAVSKGLITTEKARELSKAEAFNLIFLPGFSTAEKVTNISGRGVGMDVVKTNVSKLHGMISVESVLNAGTKIILKLPITLAILSGMIVGLNSEKFIIPLNSIIEVLRVRNEEIKTISGNEVIRIRENIIPLVSIEKYLRQKYEKKSGWQCVVVVAVAENRFGIKVDELIGQKEVVIKSLGSFIGSVNGVVGSTIMGDGTVIMILDTRELMKDLNGKQ